VAVIVAAWLVPTWGVRPLVVAVVAATAIDLDHALAAGSFELGRLMGLGARPITHSVPAALVVGGLVGLAFGRRLGYAAALGMLSHVLRDSLGPPGVPLWLFDGRAHVVLPGLVVAGGVIGLSMLSLAVSHRPRAPRAVAGAPAPSPRDAHQMTPV
jgi:membrane-bound metal-dependent hydrolase YbcI (DUF457 family)